MDLTFRCRHCNGGVRVPDAIVPQFHILDCPLCKRPLDRRGAVASQAVRAPVAAVTEPTPDDLKLLDDLKIKWEST